VKLADAIATAPRRTLKGTYWHQGPTRHPVTSCADPARGPGRYHRTGEPGVWYASNKEQGAWAELFRHFVDEGPPRLAELLPLIRPHEHVPDSVRRLLETLTRAGAEAIRRRRR
jgi:hypothetical protein